MGRLILYAALVLALGIVVVSACVPRPLAEPSPTARTPTPTASRTTTPSPAPSPASTATPTTATPTPTVPASPGSSPATACPRRTGGAQGNQAQLIGVRAAHQPGFDRLVFEFGPSTAPGPSGLPAYTIEVAGSLAGPSGQPVPITGNALLGVRFQNASTQNPNGTPSYTGGNDLRPALPLIKHVRLVEDFERVLVWGVGLERLVCPNVLTLSSPVRVVLDFPTPP